MARYRTETPGYDTLRDALTSRNAEDLKALARLFGAKYTTRKNDCIEAIEKALSGEGLRRMWESMDTLSRAAVAEVTHGADERFYLDRFVAKYNAKPQRHFEDYRDKSKSVPWTLLDVVFTSDMMPRDLKERFRAFVPKPPEPVVETVDVLPQTVTPSMRSWQSPNGKKSREPELSVCETESAACQDILAVLRLIDAGKIAVSAATRRPTLASVKAVASVLRDKDFTDGNKADDFIRAFAWPLLVQAAGLTRLVGARLELSSAGRSALSAPPHETIRVAWRRWIAKGLVDEFNRIEAIKGQKRKGRGGLTPVASRREAVQEVLAQCPIGKWIEIDEFFRYFQSTDISLEVSQDIWKLYIIDAEYGSLGYNGYHDWSMVQGRYVMALLWEYAAVLGLVDIAHIPAEGARDDFWNNWGAEDFSSLSRYDGLKFFRITNLGAYCLNIADEYVQDSKPACPSLQVLPNHDIVVRDRSAFSPADGLFLEKIALRNSEHTWKLDKKPLLDALEKGTQPEEIHRTLAAMSQTPVPENVRHFLDDIMRQAALVSFEAAAELYCTGDEATALLIAHDKNTSKLCYLAGPKRLAVPSRHAEAFRRALRKMGYIAPPKKMAP